MLHCDRGIRVAALPNGQKFPICLWVVDRLQSQAALAVMGHWTVAKVRSGVRVAVGHSCCAAAIAAGILECICRVRTVVAFVVTCTEKADGGVLAFVAGVAKATAVVTLLQGDDVFDEGSCAVEAGVHCIEK